LQTTPPPAIVPPSSQPNKLHEVEVIANTEKLCLVMGSVMQVKAFLNPILDNDALTRGLGDPEARILVEWLVERTERLVEDGLAEACVRREVDRLCRRARAIGRFVSLWCQDENAAAAYQLAATERFPWPLPTERMDPCDLMHDITCWESKRP
jgi:hypothetical protein